jgi:radical SAM protein with 4Fe4S-binding SPASM domain
MCNHSIDSAETAFMIKTIEARHSPWAAALTSAMGMASSWSHLAAGLSNLPLHAVNIRTESLVDIYRHSDLFRSQRDLERLRGKCGDCSFRTVCGGSLPCAATGAPLESDPLCPYQPRDTTLVKRAHPGDDVIDAFLTQRRIPALGGHCDSCCVFRVIGLPAHLDKLNQLLIAALANKLAVIGM